MKQHILGHCFNSWGTLLAYVGCSNLAPHVNCVYSSFSPNNLLPFLQKLYFCFHRDGHDGGELTPQVQVASLTLVLLSCTHTQLLFNSLCCTKAGTGTCHIKVLQTPIHTNHRLLIRHRGHPETNCGFCWSGKEAVFTVQRQQTGFSYVQQTLSGVRTAWWKKSTTQTADQHCYFCTFSI